MEKTLKYQLNESYAEGFNDARNEILAKLLEFCVCVPTHMCSYCRTRLIILGEEL